MMAFIAEGAKFDSYPTGVEANHLVLTFMATVIQSVELERFTYFKPSALVIPQFRAFTINEMHKRALPYGRALLD